VADATTEIMQRLVEMHEFVACGVVAVSFAGNPALAMPISLGGKDDRVTSLQLIGPRLSEAELLNAGRIIESN
jgi:amidase